MINFFIKIYGCQANIADSAHLRNYLEGLGGALVEHEKDADFIIVNTCAIRKKAEDKMFSYLGSLVKLKKKRPYLAVCVIGCVASYKKKYILSRFRNVDFVFGAREDISLLKNFLVDKIELLKTEKSLYYDGDTDMEGDALNDGNKTDCQKAQPFRRSMINIMRGCNNYCSYCIVPFTTGRERSYPIKDILEQVKRDVAAGAKEITLLGQNVNSYSDPDTGARFEVLLREVAGIDGDFWVRFVSPHPKDMTTEVLDVIAEHPKKLCAYIHLPLQSGSNKILEKMNRTYTVEEYLDLVDEIRKRLPNAKISTDIIVGFPGETEEDYQMTRNLMEKVRFQIIYSFIYSPRKYTKAALMVDDCPAKVKLARLRGLQARHREIGTELNKNFLGKTVRVLLEEYRPSDNIFVGRTEGNIKVFARGSERVSVGDFVDVMIKASRLSDIEGDIVE